MGAPYEERYRIPRQSFCTIDATPARSSGVPVVEPIELRQQDDGWQFGERRPRLHAALQPKSCTLIDIGTQGENRPAAAGAQKLRTAEAQHARVAPSAGTSTLHDRPGRL